MAQVLKEQKTDQNLPAVRKRHPQPASREHKLELESRLRREEADARSKRQKEMVLVWSAVFVILNACITSTYLVLSKASSPSDRLLAFYILGQMMSILIGVVMGKNINWKK
jgi:uncharacterized membrane protein